MSMLGTHRQSIRKKTWNSSNQIAKKNMKKAKQARSPNVPNIQNFGKNRSNLNYENFPCFK